MSTRSADFVLVLSLTNVLFSTRTTVNLSLPHPAFLRLRTEHRHVGKSAAELMEKRRSGERAWDR